jgi:hypothetical protein
MPSCMYWYVLQWYYTSVLLIIDLCTNTYSTYYVLVCTSVYWSDKYGIWHLARKADSNIHKVVGQYCQAPEVCSGILVHTSMYQCVLVHTTMYLYVRVKLLVE